MVSSSNQIVQEIDLRSPSMLRSDAQWTGHPAKPVSKAGLQTPISAKAQRSARGNKRLHREAQIVRGSAPGNDPL